MRERLAIAAAVLLVGAGATCGRAAAISCWGQPCPGPWAAITSVTVEGNRPFIAWQLLSPANESRAVEIATAPAIDPAVATGNSFVPANVVARKLYPEGMGGQGTNWLGPPLGPGTYYVHVAARDEELWCAEPPSPPAGLGVCQWTWSEVRSFTIAAGWEGPGVFLCYSHFGTNTVPAVFPLQVALTLLGRGERLWSPVALAGFDQAGDNAGAYHVVCNPGAAYGPTGQVINGGGEVLGPAYLDAYRTSFGHVLGVYELYG